MEPNVIPLGNEPAPFVPKAFTEGLNRIGGVSPTGQPRLRLVWGQELKEVVDGRRIFRYCYGNLTVGYHVKRYYRDGRFKSTTYYRGGLPPTLSQKDGMVIEPDVQEIGIDRFFVEQLVEPDLLVPHWEAVRTLAIEETGMDLMGEVPRQGMYLEGFHMIASHRDCNCDQYGRLSDGSKCYGAYRAPDERDLDFIRWMFGQLNQEAYKYDWAEMPPQEVIEQAVRDYQTANQAAIERRLVNYEEQFHDLLSPHLRRVQEGSSGGLDRFRYHDLGAAFERANRLKQDDLIRPSSKINLEPR